MITNRFSVFTKKQSLFLNIINLVQIIIGIVLIVVALISSIPQWNGTFNRSYVFTSIAGITGAISLIEIIGKTVFNRKTIAYTLLLRFYKKKDFLFSPTQIQSEVCSWANKSIQKGKNILLYGKVNTGKTTSIFIYLSQYIKNKEIIKNLSWVQNILYIDCKSRKNDILDFFEDENFFFNNQYEKSLIIIDNIETMGGAFFDQLLNVIEGSISTFILLADVCNIDIHNYNTIESKEVEERFSVKIYKKHADNFRHKYITLNQEDKKILLTIYYISMSITLIPVRNILAIWKSTISHFRICRSIKSLMRNNMIKKFPFDDSYILLVNQKAIFENQRIFWETPENTDVIMKIINSSEAFPESAWLSFIHLPYEKQLQLEQSKREKLFINALRCGNYLTLSKSLHDELIYSPNKENLFGYEMGTLYFYSSQQEKSFMKYNNLLKFTSNQDQKMRLMLKIIETTHGDVNYSTKKNIDNYLRKLNLSGIPNTLYAKYWKLHIESERGKFDLDEYNQLLIELVKIKKPNYTDVHIEIIKRCYTDIIRICHILFKSPEKRIIDNFLDFLYKNCDETTYRYYEALYINANYEHYIRLLNKILNDENCENAYYQAKTYYEIAIKAGYQNLKSVSACDLKCIDLKLYAPENEGDFDQYKDKINKFLSNAEINKVSVHIAYCETLLAKIYMIKNLVDENYYISSEKEKKDSHIKTYLKHAEKIYKDFENDYGILRIEFLKFLYHIATCNKHNDAYIALQKITGILERYPEYRRENKIVNAIKKNFDTSSRMYIISLIKAYPIIMQ